MSLKTDGDYWWSSIAGPNSVVTQVARALQEKSTVLLKVPADLPWRYPMRQQVEQTLRGPAGLDDILIETVDADELVEKLAGMPIPGIFEQEGEAGFRAWETKALEILGKERGRILATGGGCVTRPENRALLRQNGRVFWIRRDVGSLPKAGRPLSLAGDLAEMEARRRPMYQAFADFWIDNNGSLEDSVAQILSIWEGEH